ncbi:hypothetical protein D0Z07_6554 [Hyphodiscus hymeniophilus]|uniref:Uncharacterized protein n=1 Tax=Hyphodiscus hymeniophilus TaxID=353542 RepID=A0A9P6VGQ9_9HELO|nr:hypothetical protein D0Z07_6554 [Hyphodiscus hymeniophilus]
MLSRRNIILAVVCFIILVVVYDNRDILPANLPLSPSPSSLGNGTTGVTTTVTSHIKDAGGRTSPLSPHVLNYYDQVFSEKPAPFDFPAVRQQCAHTKWPEDDVYLKCGGMSAGLTSIMSQVKVCLKMALETGVGIVLPAMPLRDSKDLKEFNFLNGDAYLTYDKWFDAEFLIEQMKQACPQMKIIHPDQLDSVSFPVRYNWDIDIGKAPGFQLFNSYFWAGKSFKNYFEAEFKKLEDMEALSPNHDDSKKGITVVTIMSAFLLFRIMDDPTGNDLRLWNDLSTIIRFREEPRAIVGNLLGNLNRPFYGVHFRAESDTIWSSPDHQLAVDLEALDKAWNAYGKPGEQKPLIYLACGDQGQIEKFVSAGKERGWEVTHKWALAEGSPETLKMIDDLAFDFQGACVLEYGR